MKASLCSMLLLLASTGPTVSRPTSSRIEGEYVEARTASVFAGACHYNGELVTTGRDAVMAWHFSSGTWNGVDLRGLRVMAAVTSDENLANKSAERKSEIVIDSEATTEQASALTDLLKAKCGERLGNVISIRRDPITFDHSNATYSVQARRFAELSVRAMPNGECCKQPHLVWYSPLFPLQQRKVGFTRSAEYKAGSVGDPWKRAGENSAFYGSFSFDPQAGDA